MMAHSIEEMNKDMTSVGPAFAMTSVNIFNTADAELGRHSKNGNLLTHVCLFNTCTVHSASAHCTPKITK